MGRDVRINFGKSFVALNQIWIKPLDDFDTTWLVALRRGLLRCPASLSRYFTMGEAQLFP
jgi:hypothetical protein